MRKTLLSTLLACIAITAVTGCGNRQPAQSTTAPATPASGETQQQSQVWAQRAAAMQAAKAAGH